MSSIRTWWYPGFTVAVIIALVPSSANGQAAGADSVSWASPRFTMGYERNVNTHLWNISGRWNHRSSSWDVVADEQYRRSLIRTDRSYIKDEQSLIVRGERHLTETWGVEARFKSYVFADDRALGLNSLAEHALLAGPVWRPSPYLMLRGQGGYSFDNQQRVLDQGFAYLGSARIQGLRFGTYDLNADLISEGHDLGPRQLSENRAVIALSAAFSPRSRNDLTVRIQSMNRDFYLVRDSLVERTFGVEHPVESRKESGYGVINNLQYRVSDYLDFRGSFRLNYNTIARSRRYRVPDVPLPFFDTRFDEFILGGKVATAFHDDKTSGVFEIGVDERNENHTIETYPDADPVAFARQQRLEEMKNYVVTQSQLALNVVHRIGNRDTISFYGSALKLRYDTPSKQNFDDRDELYYLLQGRWAHRFSPLLRGSILIDINLRHTVYIFAERSANNTWNRVIRLRPEVAFRNSILSNALATEVLANYTVYDFESTSLQVQSFSFRQLTVMDSLRLRISRSLFLKADLMWRVYERGDLFWETFSSRPQRYFDERTVSTALVVEGDWYRVAPGYRFFIQSRYRYEGNERQKDGDVANYGPMCRMDVFLSRFTSIVLDGWYQVTSESTGGTRVYPNLTLQVVWNM
ncbi:MAG: hypothetical protein GXO82_06425 [Chlorobi bacterium]|nr:hypothetical protein [Chlorobiota bacterium]